MYGNRGFSFLHTPELSAYLSSLGYTFEEIDKIWLAIVAALPFCDGPIPIGDILAVIIVIILLIVIASLAIQQSKKKKEEKESESEDKSDSKEESDGKGEDSSDKQKGIGGKGWRGDKKWKQNVNKVREGGTIPDLDGQVPTEQEAIDLINEAGGTVNRIEGPHESPNPHNYNHINYTTPSGLKGTIRIQ